MVNLLPQTEKKNFLKLYRLRIGIILLIAMFFVEIAAAALFFPAYYVVDSATVNLADELEKIKNITPEGEGAAQQELAVIKKDIAILKPGTAVVDTLPSVLFSEIFSRKPDGIKITSINYARNLKDAAIQLGGNALTSEDMLLFQKNLKENPRVANTQYASNSFIIKKTDIDFIMTITLK